MSSFLYIDTLHYDISVFEVAVTMRLALRLLIDWRGGGGRLPSPPHFSVTPAPQYSTYRDGKSSKYRPTPLVYIEECLCNKYEYI
jgi:hypothetical protein